MRYKVLLNTWRELEVLPDYLAIGRPFRGETLLFFGKAKTQHEGRLKGLAKYLSLPKDQKQYAEISSRQ